MLLARDCRGDSIREGVLVDLGRREWRR
jgi:hypothetical protein